MGRSAARCRCVVDCRLDGRDGPGSRRVCCEDGDGPADDSEVDEVRLEAPDGRLSQAVESALDESLVIVDAYELRRVMLALKGPSSERT